MTSHHLAGGVLGQTVHHGVHLVELLEGVLHLGVELLVLRILVIKHGSVLIPLLIGLDQRVLTVRKGGRGGQFEQLRTVNVT